MAENLHRHRISPLAPKQESQGSQAHRPPIKHPLLTCPGLGRQVPPVVLLNESPLFAHATIHSYLPFLNFEPTLSHDRNLVWSVLYLVYTPFFFFFNFLDLVPLCASRSHLLSAALQTKRSPASTLDRRAIIVLDVFSQRKHSFCVFDR